MSTPTTHNINGTLFTFPQLPSADNISPKLLAEVTEGRTKILDRATKIKPRKRRKSVAPRKPRKVPAGTGEFTAKRGEPGDTINVEGYGELVVWSIITAGSRCWVTTDDGRYLDVCVRTGRVVGELSGESVRDAIVNAAYKRFGWYRAYRVASEWDGVGAYRNETHKAARGWAYAAIAHELFPSVHEDPGVFVAPGRVSVAA